MLQLTDMNSRGKKILFIAPTNELIAGGEISHFELIKSAKKRGYKVFVALPAKGSFNTALRKLHIKTLLTHYTFWHPDMYKGNTAINLEAITAIADFIKHEHIECVITNTLNIPWGALAAAMTNTPHIWIAREFPENEFSYLKDKYRFISSFSNTLIANSQNLSKYMQTTLQLPQTKYFYSYVDIRGIKLNKNLQDTRIVHIGSILPRKNQLETLRAVVLLRDKHLLTPKLIFIGSLDRNSTYFKQLQVFITKNNLQKQVRFLGYKTSPFSYVGKQDIIIQPSKSESIGRVVTESMKLGLITIGSDIDGNKEAFRLGGGILYSLGDSTDLSNKIAAVLISKDSYSEQAKIAQKNTVTAMSETVCSDPFFVELNKQFDQPNPMNVLDQLLPFLDISQLINSHSNEIRRHTKTIRAYETQLQDIANSRSRRAVVQLNKLLGRKGSAQSNKNT